MPPTDTAMSSTIAPVKKKDPKYDGSSHENRVAFLVNFFIKKPTYISVAKAKVDNGRKLELPFESGRTFPFDKKDVYAACQRIEQKKNSATVSAGESKQKTTAHVLLQRKKARNAAKTPAAQTQASANGASVGSQESIRARLEARRIENNQSVSDKSSDPFAPLNLKRPASSDTGGDKKRAKIESSTDTSHMTPMERVRKLERKKSGEKLRSYERAATDDPDAPLMKTVASGKTSLELRARMEKRRAEKFSQGSMERPKSADLAAGSGIQSVSTKPRVKSPPREKEMFADINTKLFGGSNNY